MQRRVFFVGSDAEVSHHAAPLMQAEAFSTKVIGPTEVVDTAQSGDIAIFFSEHFDRFREAVAELKSKRVATIYLVDGILEWRNAWENREDEPACPFTMRPVLCDKVATIGASQARVLTEWGNGGKVEVVGIPRLDQWTKSWLGAEAFQPEKSELPMRILVATAKTPGFTEKQIQTTKQGLSELKSFFDGNQKIGGRELNVTWRLTAGLEEVIGVENSLSDLSGIELQEALADCDAFITTPSTAMLESMLQHKPTALLDYHVCPRYVPSAWTIHSRDSIETVVAQLANPLAIHMQFQNSALSDALQVAESATERLVQLIHSMFASCDQQQASGNPLKFESNLLPDPIFASQLGGAHCKMDYATVFASFNEFTEDNDAVQLRAQLAHARREIDHLHRIEAGLRDELAEAHSIFEQIHQHPIAGPIVRIRERFIQFMKRNKKEND